MFYVNRWTDTFVAIMGKDADAGLACLKAMVKPIKTIPGALFGYSASRRLETLLLESANAAGFSEMSVCYVIRFITLLVENHQFEYIDSIIRSIEALLDKEKGVLNVILESAVDVDGAFEEQLRKALSAYAKTEKVNIKKLLIPELLGGYRIRVGGFYIDASLRGQIEKMKTDLEKAVSRGIT